MKTIYSDEFNVVQRFFKKWFGLWRISGRELEFKWGSFVPRFGFTFLLHRGTYFDNRWAIQICPIFGWWLIKFPITTKLEPACDMPRYGINIHSNSLWLYKNKPLCWYIPWFNYEFDGHWVLNKNKEYVFMERDMQSWEWKKTDGSQITLPYRYELKSGEVQERIATVYQEKRQWHRKWFPFVKLVRECIDVEFNEEIGEGISSWKGGTVGCGYDLLPNESMEACLRRMEKERKFKR